MDRIHDWWKDLRGERFWPGMVGRVRRRSLIWSRQEHGEAHDHAASRQCGRTS